MVQTILNYFIGKMGGFFGWLSSMEFVQGLSIGAFLAATFIIGALIKNFLFTGR